MIKIWIVWTKKGHAGSNLCMKGHFKIKVLKKNHINVWLLYLSSFKIECLKNNK